MKRTRIVGKLTIDRVGPLFCALLVATAGAACDNPAKDAAHATVSQPAAVASQAVPASAATYGFSQADSKIAFVGAKVTRKHDGSFGAFRGTITVPNGDATKGLVTVDVDAASISTDTEKLTGHLKSPDFFDAEKFPKVSFRSTSIAAGGPAGATHTIVGNLTLHGVTKSISFPAKVEVSPAATNVDAEFAINRKDFGITYPGMADDLIRDDVLVRLTVRAAKTGS
jgi:polyisoprenoid-binding protein YceI